MNRFDRKQRGVVCVILALVAAMAWPATAWSRAASQMPCRAAIEKLLENWAKQLAASTPDKPEPIVGTYRDDATLLPTCENGPASGKGEITKYFEKFLAKEPSATIDPTKAEIGGNCSTNAYASGLYIFTLKAEGSRQVRARFTYVFRSPPNFRQWRIAQHHSSLEPDPPGANQCGAH